MKVLNVCVNLRWVVSISPGTFVLSTFSLVTINILNDLSLWEQRSTLLVDQLEKLNADLIAIQEVRLKGESSNAHWLCEMLNQCQENPGKSVPYQVSLCQRTGMLKNNEGAGKFFLAPPNYSFFTRSTVNHH